jgi:transcriptional regulator with XRE-family HTH domain
MTFKSCKFAKAMNLKAFLILIIMELGQNIMLIRKKKGLSQADLGKIIGTSGDVIGRYERGDIKPSIEVVEKIAESFEVSIDYLVGKTNILVDKQVIERLENITSLPDEKKDYIFNLIDMCLRDFKNKQAYAS